MNLAQQAVTILQLSLQCKAQTCSSATSAAMARVHDGALVASWCHQAAVQSVWTLLSSE